MSGLVYPMIPLPVTTTVTTTAATAAITTTTSFADSATVDFRSSAEPETNSSTGATRPSTTASRRAAVTSSASRDPSWMTSRETSDVDAIVVALVIGVSAVCLLAFALFGAMVFVVRRHRRSGKYDPSRPRAPVDGCRRRCVPCWSAVDGQGSTEVPEFDASTARLKLDTSALSGTSTAGDRTRVSDRSLTDRVTTRPDPVQQTLIGPPSTNDAQSR